MADDIVTYTLNIDGSLVEYAAIPNRALWPAGDPCAGADNDHTVWIKRPGGEWPFS